jgi:hypothetical protein
VAMGGAVVGLAACTSTTHTESMTATAVQATPTAVAPRTIAAPSDAASTSCTEVSLRLAFGSTTVVLQASGQVVQVPLGVGMTTSALGPCAGEVSFTIGPSSDVVTAVRPNEWMGSKAGDATLNAEIPMCALLPASTRPESAGGLGLLAAITLRVG